LTRLAAGGGGDKVRGVRILMVASEAMPFVKSGIVAEKLRALPRALARLGHDVDVVIPRYRGITAGERIATVSVALGGQVAEAGIHAVTAAGVRTAFVDHPGYFDRDYLYGAGGHDYADNPERFAFLSQAALNWAVSTGAPYDVVHGQDWQAGLVPVLLGRMFRSQAALKRLPAVFTVHNLAYQGIFDASWLPRLGLGWELMRTDALEYWSRISLLKAGIVFSRAITVPSPRYAREIQTPELGLGFDGLFRERAADLVGILDGIDYDQWDPARDTNLPRPYSASNLEGKDAAKQEVLARFGIPATAETRRRPLVAIVTPLVAANGFDLLADLVDTLPGMGATFVVQGTGERRYEDQWLALAARHPDRIGMRLGNDEALAHAIEAGADLFLMPTCEEPSGVNARVSMRYGTVPLVRATGGMFDTVRNYDPGTGDGTGFMFEDYSAPALLATLRWALDVFQDREAWQRIQAAGMRPEYSWDEAAKQYVRVYERVATQPVWQ
jgi:starch synthase